MNKSRRKLILAFETGINGGSLAVLQDGKTICTTQGAGNVSRSEDLLAMLEALLEENGLNKEEIGMIAVSDSPGSATGLRIGLSTARGLADALGAEVFKFSVLQAQISVSGAIGQTVSALYSEKSGIYYRHYDQTGNNLIPQTEILNKRDLRDFIDSIEAEKYSYVLDKGLGILLNERDEYGYLLENNQISVLASNPAESLAIAAFKSASDNAISFKS